MQSVHSPRNVRELQGKASAPDPLRSALAALRMRSNWLVTDRVINVNPAHARAETLHAERKDASAGAEARALLDAPHRSDGLHLSRGSALSLEFDKFSEVGTFLEAISWTADTFAKKRIRRRWPRLSTYITSYHLPGTGATE